MDVKVAAKSDVGRVRQNNQDAYLTALPLVAVADGMGGHKAGEVASALALEVLQEWKDGGGRAETLAEGIREANRRVLQRGQSDESMQGMGTTLTAAWLDDATVTLAHVGDSRAYLIRSGRAEQLTRDDTQVQRWVDEGRLDPEEATRHPYRNYLEQALGIDEVVNVETLEVELRPGDRLLISSDGLHGPVAGDAMARIVMEAADAQAACDALVDAANTAGGEDNITVVLIEVPRSRDEAGTDDGPVIVSRPSASTPPARRRGIGLRSPLVIGAAVAAVLVVAAAVAVTTFGNAPSYIVAVSDGKVAIIKGRPGNSSTPPKGDVVKLTDVPITELPLSYQRQVEQGIVVSSLREAEQTVRDLPRILGPAGQLPASPPAIEISPPPLPQ